MITIVWRSGIFDFCFCLLTTHERKSLTARRLQLVAFGGNTFEATKMKNSLLCRHAEVVAATQVVDLPRRQNRALY